MLAFTRFANYFLEVARLGSLRKAAETLHVSASAIDRQILLAEGEFGMALFERLPSGLKLTSAGELLLDDLRRWRKEYARTMERFSELQGLKRGHVSIAVIDALSTGLLAHAVAEIGAEFPHLAFDLQVVENRKVLGMLHASEVDFALVLDPVEQIGLDIRTLAKYPIGIAMPIHHALAQEPHLTLGQTMGYRHIVPSEPLLIHERVQAIYARGRINEKQTIACNDTRLIRSLIQQDAGIGILSYLDVASDVQDGHLAFVPLQGRQVKPLTLALCVASHRQLSRAVQLVIARIAQAFQDFAEPRK